MGVMLVVGFCIYERSTGSRYFGSTLPKRGSGMYIGYSISYLNTDLNGSSWMEDQNPTVPCLLIFVLLPPLDLQMFNRLKNHELSVSSLVFLFSLFSAAGAAC